MKFAPSFPQPDMFGEIQELGRSRLEIGTWCATTNHLHWMKIKWKMAIGTYV